MEYENSANLSTKTADSSHRVSELTGSMGQTSNRHNDQVHSRVQFDSEMDRETPYSRFEDDFNRNSF